MCNVLNDECLLLKRAENNYLNNLSKCWSYCHSDSSFPRRVCFQIHKLLRKQVVAVASHWFLFVRSFITKILRANNQDLQVWKQTNPKKDDDTGLAFCFSDCAVIEMSLRISLYCSDSHHRIKTPVKGHLCKHPQCFDYNDFIEVNSIKPTWKCPLCNNPVCNRDMRIDQDFLKILNDVPKDVDAVIIYEDGSWMVAETDMGKSQATVTPPAVFVGQTQVDVFTTTQAQSTTVFTPAATVTPPVVSPCQTPVNVGTTQVKCETMLTPRAVSDQIRVNTTLAQSTGAFTPPAVSRGNITQVKSETMLTPPAGSDQIRVNTTQAHSTSVLTPPVVSPGNITQVKSETMLTPPAGSTDQIRVNVVTTRAQSTSVFTQPAVSPGNIYTTQAKSTSVFTSIPLGSLYYSEARVNSKKT